MRKFFLFFLFTGMMIPGIYAQEDEPFQNSFQGTRFINGQSVNMAKDGELLLLIQHRFGDISNGFYDFFGLDLASMRLGFEYGFGKNINAGIGRSTWLKTYDAFVKYRLVEQSGSFPFSSAITLSGSLPTLRNYFPDTNNNFSDKFSWNTQLLLAKTIGKFGVQLSPGYLKTGYLPALNNNLSIFTMGFAGSFRFAKKASANVEYLVPFNNNISGEHALSLSVDIATGGHLFQLIVSNNQRMFVQSYYTDTSGSWTKGNLFLGFNLIRKFNLKYYY